MMMDSQISKILITKNQTVTSQPEEKTDITPERVYKNFQEWRKLGKQDPTEPQVPSQPSQPQESEENKSTPE